MKTTIKGKEINLFNMTGISAFYTETITNYLSQGYIFYVGAGRGHQGEEAKVVLTNDSGKSALVIYIDKTCSYYGSNGTIEIITETFENVQPGDTLWLQKGKVIDKKTFWKVSRNSKEIYCESESDFNLIKEVQEKRFHLKCECSREEIKEIKSETYKKLVLKLLKKERGYKTMTLKNIIKIGRVKNELDVWVTRDNKRSYVVTIHLSK